MAKPVLTLADIDLLKKVFATKKDLQNFATKKDLQSFATKKDLTQLEKRLGNRFASKEDLRALAEELKSFTKEQLEEFSIFLSRKCFPVLFARDHRWRKIGSSVEKH